MTDAPRKKSPRAPSMSLDEALERTGKVYDSQRLHTAPTDAVAVSMGYKSANGGTALSALASLRYYGLLERPSEGRLSVAKDYEAFRFAPTEQIKQSLLLKFLRAPALFADLLDTYQDGLPSDAVVKFELISRGFLPTFADAVLGVLKRSIEFVGPAVVHTSTREGAGEAHSQPPAAPPQPTHAAQAEPSPALGTSQSHQPAVHAKAQQPALAEDPELDRIPVRLTGGRKAWLLIPAVFMAADKDRLKSQIDLLLTQEDEASDDDTL